MSTTFELTAEPREAMGTGASRRLRRSGKVPAIMYGASKEPISLALDHNQVYHNLENEAFHSSLISVKLGSTTEQAILRDVQMHPFKPRIIHVDLQRISATEKLHLRVPLHFVGAEISPGVKLQNGIVNHLMTEVDVSCLPTNLPEYLEVDLSGLNLHESVHLSDLKAPAGVEITNLAHGGDDHAVAAIVSVRGAATGEETTGEAAAEEAGEEPAGQ